jgi:homoserine dehydrogenase
MFYGRGAGGDPTASAVLGDVVAVARHKVAGGRGPGESAYADLPVVDMGQASRGTTSASTSPTARVCSPRSRTAFAEHDVSIETVRQQVANPGRASGRSSSS